MMPTYIYWSRSSIENTPEDERTKVNCEIPVIGTDGRVTVVAVEGTIRVDRLGPAVVANLHGQTVELFVTWRRLLDQVNGWISDPLDLDPFNEHPILEKPQGGAA